MAHDTHDHHDSHGEEPKKANIVLRIAIIAGMLLLLFFIAGTIVNVVPKFISKIGTASVSLSSFFNPKDDITVTAEPSTVESGDRIRISWVNNNDDKEGRMIFSYECTDGVSMSYESVSGTKPVGCETNFPLPASGSYTFTAGNDLATRVEVPISVSLWDADMKAAKFSGESSFGILPKGYEDPEAPSNTNGNTQATTTRPTNTNTTLNPRPVTPTYTGTGVRYTGPADLSIRLIQVGGVDSSGNMKTGANGGDRVIVRFNVANIGGSRSGTWQLQGSLPTQVSSEQTYVSSVQPALNAGDSYDMTLSFDSFDPTRSTITLTIVGGDTSTGNNTLSVGVPYSGTGSTGSTGSRPDLSVRILDLGFMDSREQFYTTSSSRFDEDDTIAIRFEVSNVGGSATGTWDFEVELPTEDNDTFRSGNLSSIGPGQKMIYTLGFDNLERGSHTLEINVDPSDDIRENSENNNDDSVSVRIDD